MGFVAVMLAAALVVLAYVFLTRGPERLESTSASTPAQKQEQSNAAEAPQPQSAQLAEDKSSTATSENPAAKRETTTRGDTRHFSLFHGEIGYVDVASILQDRNPYSILALLQSHKELTGAGDFLEIEISGTPRENEIWGYEARFRQLIEGQSTTQLGSVLFSADGAVGGLSGHLVNPESLAASPVLILQPEAETIAREAAIRYAASVSDVSPSDTDLATEIISAISTYRSDSEDNVRKVWSIGVSIDSPKWDAFDTPKVFISPETGEVIEVVSGLVYDRAQTSPCNTVTFNVCNANGAKKNSCSGNTLPLKPAHYTASVYAENVITSVSAVSEDHIKRPAGYDCEIDMIMERPLSGDLGAYNSATDTIAIDPKAGNDQKVVTHETFHALTRTSPGDVEHGLVYAMTALELGGGDWESSAHDNFAEHPDTYRVLGWEPEPYHAYVHTFYMISQEVGAGSAFQLALGVDLREPTSGARLDEAIIDIAEGLEIGTGVAEAFTKIELNKLAIYARQTGLSQGTIDEVIAAARKKAKREGTDDVDVVEDMLGAAIESLPAPQDISSAGPWITLEELNGRDPSELTQEELEQLFKRWMLEQWRRRIRDG